MMVVMVHAVGGLFASGRDWARTTGGHGGIYSGRTGGILTRTICGVRWRNSVRNDRKKTHITYDTVEVAATERATAA